ncbi:GNAT family N-acetyltransferase, partial [Streptomyces vinaceus]
MPKPATIDEASWIGRILALAFDDDPMMRWFFPDGPGAADGPGEAAREARLARYFSTIFTRQYAHHGVCEYTDAAAAFWVPPGAADKAVPDAATVEELSVILGDRAPLFPQAAEAAPGEAPTQPHRNLAENGADPA